jgi:hypothetical protein
MYVENMKFKLKSITPLLFNRRSFMLDKLQDPSLEQKDKPKESKLDYELRICKEKAYYDEKGHLDFPSQYFLAAFKESQRQTRCPIVPEGGKKKGTLLNYLSAILVSDLHLPQKREDLQDFATIVCLQQGMKKMSMPCVRPKLPSWEGLLEITSASECVTLKQVQPMVEYCGKFLGIGDWTPRCSGRFGMFEVVKASSDIQ